MADKNLDTGAQVGLAELRLNTPDYGGHPSSLCKVAEQSGRSKIECDGQQWLAAHGIYFQGWLLTLAAPKNDLLGRLLTSDASKNDLQRQLT